MPRGWIVIALALPSVVFAEASAPDMVDATPVVTAEPSLDDHLSPITGALLENLRAVYARNDRLHDDVFAKMGGSIVVSRAFLHCLGTEYVVLDGQGELQEAIEFFGERRVRGRSSFRRDSLATGVGWSLYYPLAGRPPRFAREVHAIKPRYSLVLFGGNDSNAKIERVYARRLVKLVERLMERGVIPILGTSPPRRSKQRDLWIRRYNDIGRAIAEHWHLPFIDFDAAMRELPRWGLARDGIHPNVYGAGGLANACRFDEDGLEYGQNVRNLLTLKMLDRLRRAGLGEGVVAGGEVGAVHVSGSGAESASGAGPGTEEVLASVVREFEASALPFSARLGNESEVVVRVTVDEPTRVRASAFALKGPRPRLSWVREDGTTRRRRYQTLHTKLAAGRWALHITRPASARADSRLLVLVTEGP